MPVHFEEFPLRSLNVIEWNERTAATYDSLMSEGCETEAAFYKNKFLNATGVVPNQRKTIAKRLRVLAGLVSE